MGEELLMTKNSYIFAIVLIGLAALLVAYLIGVIIERKVKGKRGNDIWLMIPAFIVVYVYMVYGYIFIPQQHLVDGNYIYTFNSTSDFFYFSLIGESVKAFALSLGSTYTSGLGEMLAANADKEVIINVLIVLYQVLPILCTAILSYSVISLFFKTFIPKIKNFFSWTGISFKQFILFNPIIKFFYQVAYKKKPELKNRVYILTETKVEISRILGLCLKELKGEDKCVVSVVIPFALTLTQEGSEFKQSLILNGFDVICENISYNFLKYFVGRGNAITRWLTRGTRKVFFSLFYDDGTNIDIAKKFYDIIHLKKKNSEKLVKGSYGYYIKKIETLQDVIDTQEKNIKANVKVKKAKRIIKKKLKKINKYLNILDTRRFYVSCQDKTPFETYPFISESFNMIKYFSEYDIASLELIMNCPINMFVNDIRSKALKVGFATDSIVDDPMNVYFFGFGEVNQEIFRKMVPAYQLSGDLTDLVSYHIVDKDGDELISKVNKAYYDGKVNKYPFNLPLNVSLESAKKAFDSKIREYFVTFKNANGEKYPFDEKVLKYGLDTVEKIFSDSSNHLVDKVNSIRGAFYATLIELTRNEHEIYMDEVRLFELDSVLGHRDLTDDKVVDLFINDLNENNKLVNAEFNMFIVSLGTSSNNLRVANSLQKSLQNLLKRTHKANNSYIYSYLSDSHFVHKFIKNSKGDFYDKVVATLDSSDEILENKDKVLAPIFCFGGGECIKDYLVKKSKIHEEFGMWQNFLYSHSDFNIKNRTYLDGILAYSLWNKDSTLANQVANTYSLHHMELKLAFLGDYKMDDDLSVKEKDPKTGKYSKIKKIPSSLHSFDFVTILSKEDEIIRDNIVRLEHNRYVAIKELFNEHSAAPINYWYAACLSRLEEFKDTYNKIKVKESIGKKNRNNDKELNELYNSIISKGFSTPKAPGLNSCLLNNNDLRSIEGLTYYLASKEQYKSKDDMILLNTLRPVQKVIYDNDLTGVVNLFNIFNGLQEKIKIKGR